MLEIKIKVQRLVGTIIFCTTIAWPTFSQNEIKMESVFNTYCFESGVCTRPIFKDMLVYDPGVIDMPDGCKYLAERFDTSIVIPARLEVVNDSARTHLGKNLSILLELYSNRLYGDPNNYYVSQCLLSDFFDFEAPISGENGKVTIGAYDEEIGQFEYEISIHENFQFNLEDMELKLLEEKNDNYFLFEMCDTQSRLSILFTLRMPKDQLEIEGTNVFSSLVFGW